MAHAGDKYRVRVGGVLRISGSALVVEVELSGTNTSALIWFDTHSLM